MALLKLSSDIIASQYCDEEGDYYVADKLTGEIKLWHNHRPTAWNAYRSLSEYFDSIGMPSDTSEIKGFFSKLSKTKESFGLCNKLTILDAGFGSGRAIREMLSLPFIGRVYGITNEGIDEIKDLVDDERVHLYLGELNETSEEFQDIDLVLDVFGCYLYSNSVELNKFDVLLKYHNFLSAQGEAYVGPRKYIASSLSDSYPNIFGPYGSYSIHMKKPLKRQELAFLQSNGNKTESCGVDAKFTHI